MAEIQGADRPGRDRRGAEPRRSRARRFDSMMSGDATPSQMGGFLMALRVRGETVDEITGAAGDARQDAARSPRRPTPSTSSAPAATARAPSTSRPRRLDRRRRRRAGRQARQPRAVVALRRGRRAGRARRQHRPRAARRSSRCIREAGIGFMFAPAHHPAMHHVGPTRVELGTRTIFNLLGPLSNPAGVKRQLVGVFSRQWVEPLAAGAGQSRLRARLGRARLRRARRDHHHRHHRGRRARGRRGPHLRDHAGGGRAAARVKPEACAAATPTPTRTR